MNNLVEKEIVWSKGKTRKEMSKQTFWSSSKDCSGLSGLEVRAYDFKEEVIINIFKFLLKRSKSFVML